MPYSKRDILSGQATIEGGREETDKKQKKKFFHGKKTTNHFKQIKIINIFFWVVWKCH